MSIDVCIKQKGLFKKTIPLDVIVGDELAFGINDGMRMVGDDLSVAAFHCSRGE